MCGIFGYIDPHLSRQHLEHVVAVSLESIRHRGPDGDGTFVESPVAMGMRRLSILDIEKGFQPFFSDQDSVVAFQNGEIYNFKDLKNELEQSGFSFSSNCDTEVIAHGYVHWGISGLLRRLDGMFALAVLDKRKRKLFLARDRYGEKPLFIASSSERFAYSSSLLPLAALPWVDASFAGSSLLRYLCLGFVPGEATICKGVKRIPPGCVMAVDIATGASDLGSYTAFPCAEPVRESYDADALDEALFRAVRTRLLADVPVGLFLSGGIDSSLIAHYAATAQPGIQTFSIGFNDAAHDESAHAAMVAAKAGTRHHHFLFEKDDFLTLLPDVAGNMDEPIGDQACLPLLLLSRQARKHVTVVLAGEGGDELFGGYSYYSQWMDATPTPPAPLLEHPQSVTASGFPFMLSLMDGESWLEDPDSKELPYEKELRRQLALCPDMLRRARLCDIMTWLPDDLLVKLDRMTMAASLEGRAPYLAPDLIPYLTLKPELCIRGNESKLPLRALAKRHLPRETWDRPKQGFILPMRSWLQGWFASHGGGSVYCMAHPVPGLKNGRIAQWINAMLTDPQQNGWERPMFSVLMLYEWARHFSEQRARLAGRIADGH